MDFIIGGAHQGKLDFACSRFGVSDDDVLNVNTIMKIRISLLR